jgi:site-specific DNA-methyltransferase (adenine-specific)
MNKAIHGDCLIESEQIESGSVDLILTDPPYGNMRGINNPERPKSWGNPEYWKWDNGIKSDDLYATANRILRKNGKLILFAQQPYTTELIQNAIPNLPHSYNMIWEKNDFANALLSKKAPVSYYEDILVFSKTHDHEALHPLRLYFKDVMDYIGLNLKQINNTLGHRRAEHTFYIDSTQYGLCTEETYNKLIEVFGIDKMAGFRKYAELKQVDCKFKEDLPSTFNLWEGKKYKNNILKYAKDYDGYHPTQKPVLLLEDLIKTFSNEGDLVVDLTAGSGSTAVACRNTGRNYIVIEKEQKYIDIINKRIAEHENQLSIV